MTITEAQLVDWKTTWRQLVSSSLGKAFSAIEERLPAESPKADALLLLKAQLNEANRDKVMGVKSAEDLELAYNRIRLNLLEFIKELELSDFNAMGSGFQPAAKRGVLLHKIPKKMAVGREEECIIRLAYERSLIADNLEITEEVEVKEVTISEVMEAELIDPNAEPAFNIRTFHDERQFLTRGEYTEWKFYVSPLREGHFRLLLKLTVIEEVKGEKERRNITWEEQVMIVTELSTAEPATFEAAGVALAFSGGAEAQTSGAGPEEAIDLPRVEAFSPPRPAPAPAFAPQSKDAAGGQATRSNKPRSGAAVRGLSAIASVALVLSFGLWWLSSGERGLTSEQAGEGVVEEEPPIRKPNEQKDMETVDSLFKASEERMVEIAPSPPAREEGKASPERMEDIAVTTEPDRVASDRRPPTVTQPHTGTSSQAKPASPGRAEFATRTGALKERKALKGVPHEIRDAGEAGKVAIKVCVDEDGDVISAELGEASVADSRLHQAALQAARQWRFEAKAGALRECGELIYSFQAN